MLDRCFVLLGLISSPQVFVLTFVVLSRYFNQLLTFESV